jgi:hypothetical protein
MDEKDACMNVVRRKVTVGHCRRLAMASTPPLRSGHMHTIFLCAIFLKFDMRRILMYVVSRILCLSSLNSAGMLDTRMRQLRANVVVPSEILQIPPLPPTTAAVTAEVDRSAP